MCSMREARLQGLQSRCRLGLHHYLWELRLEGLLSIRHLKLGFMLCSLRLDLCRRKGRFALVGALMGLEVWRRRLGIWRFW